MSLRVQATLRRNVAPDPRLDPAAAAARLGALDFKAGSEALFLGRAHYGCVAAVLPSASLGLTKQVCTLPYPRSDSPSRRAPYPTLARTHQAGARAQQQHSSERVWPGLFCGLLSFAEVGLAGMRLPA